ncbi:MAG: signal peptidase II [Planctomycetes bacterium]|nr:signal peptidase II [Planctomycetota bacterium]
MLGRKLLFFLALAAAVTAADLVTKSIVFSRLPHPGQTVSVIGKTFEIVHHTNTGGMWGVGQSWNPWILRLVRFAAVAVVLVILYQTRPGDRVSVVSLGMIMGGAVGNIHDSLRLGSVRDFLKFDFGFDPFHAFPTFNIADSAICVGVGLLALQMLLSSGAGRKEAGEGSARE